MKPSNDNERNAKSAPRFAWMSIAPPARPDGSAVFESPTEDSAIEAAAVEFDATSRS
jgi:hypothetical protein